MSNQQFHSESASPKEIRPINLARFAIQLQNVVPVDIVARRFPMDIIENLQVNLQITLESINIDASNLQAQTILNVKIEPLEPRPFEIFLKIVGLFSYSSEYGQEKVHDYLQQGCISVILPFARELVASLCTRLQIPIIMLSLIQLEASDNIEKANE